MRAKASKGKGLDREITASDLKTNPSAAINRVRYGGERIVVTWHGYPAVALVSTADLAKLEAVA